MRIKENHHAGEEEKTSERSVKFLLFGMFSRKKKEERSSAPQPAHEDSSLMARDKTKKSTHMSVSDTEKLKHSLEKEKPQDDNKKKGMRITTTKNHLFLKRMTSISQKKLVVKEEHSLSSQDGGDSDDQRESIASDEKGTMRISTTKSHLFLKRMNSISQRRHVVKEEHSLSSQDGGDSDDQRESIASDEKGIMRISTTKNHFFLERMTSISQKRSQHHHHVIKKKHNLSDQSFAKCEEDAQRRSIESLLPGYSSPLLRSPLRICDQNPTLLTRPASDNLTKSETLAANSKEKEESAGSLSQDSSPSQSKNFVTFEISELEAYYHVEKENKSSHKEILPQRSLLADEYKLVLEPLFIQYEINPLRGESKGQTLCNQFEEEEDVPMDEKETVFKYVKAVLDSIDSSWEDMYLKTKFSDQILNPALFSNIPFSPSQLCAANDNHKLIFDYINELIFEFCRFPSFVKPRTQVLSFSDESIVHEVQKKVYSRLFPLQFADSAGQIIREDMDKPRNWWLDVRCEVECIGFEASELILNDLLDQLILDMCR